MHLIIRIPAVSERIIVDPEWESKKKEIYSKIYTYNAKRNKVKIYLEAIDRMANLITNLALTPEQKIDFSKDNSIIETNANFLDSDQEYIKNIRESLTKLKDNLKNSESSKTLNSFDSFMHLEYLLNKDDIEQDKKIASLVALEHPLKRCAEGAVTSIDMVANRLSRNENNNLIKDVSAFFIDSTKSTALRQLEILLNGGRIPLNINELILDPHAVVLFENAILKSNYTVEKTTDKYANKRIKGGEGKYLKKGIEIAIVQNYTLSNFISEEFNRLKNIYSENKPKFIGDTESQFVTEFVDKYGLSRKKINELFKIEGVDDFCNLVFLFKQIMSCELESAKFASKVEGNIVDILYINYQINSDLFTMEFNNMRLNISSGPIYEFLQKIYFQKNYKQDSFLEDLSNFIGSDELVENIVLNKEFIEYIIIKRMMKEKLIYYVDKPEDVLDVNKYKEVSWMTFYPNSDDASSLSGQYRYTLLNASPEQHKYSMIFEKDGEFFNPQRLNVEQISKLFEKLNANEFYSFLSINSNNYTVLHGKEKSYICKGSNLADLLIFLVEERVSCQELTKIADIEYGIDQILKNNPDIIELFKTEFLIRLANDKYDSSDWLERKVGYFGSLLLNYANDRRAVIVEVKDSFYSMYLTHNNEVYIGFENNYMEIMFNLLGKYNTSANIKYVYDEINHVLKIYDITVLDLHKYIIEKLYKDEISVEEFKARLRILSRVDPGYTRAFERLIITTVADKACYYTYLNSKNEFKVGKIIQEEDILGVLINTINELYPIDKQEVELLNSLVKDYLNSILDILEDNANKHINDSTKNSPELYARVLTVIEYIKNSPIYDKFTQKFKSKNVLNLGYGFIVANNQLLYTNPHNNKLKEGALLNLIVDLESEIDSIKNHDAVIKVEAIINALSKDNAMRKTFEELDFKWSYFSFIEFPEANFFNFSHNNSSKCFFYSIKHNKIINLTTSGYIEPELKNDLYSYVGKICDMILSSGQISERKCFLAIKTINNIEKLCGTSYNHLSHLYLDEGGNKVYIVRDVVLVRSGLEFLSFSLHDIINGVQLDKIGKEELITIIAKLAYRKLIAGQLLINYDKKFKLNMFSKIPNSNYEFFHLSSSERSNDFIVKEYDVIFDFKNLSANNQTYIINSCHMYSCSDFKLPKLDEIFYQFKINDDYFFVAYGKNNERYIFRTIVPILEINEQNIYEKDKIWMLMFKNIVSEEVTLRSKEEAIFINDFKFLQKFSKNTDQCSIEKISKGLYVIHPKDAYEKSEVFFEHNELFYNLKYMVRPQDDNSLNAIDAYKYKINNLLSILAASKSLQAFKDSKNLSTVFRNNNVPLYSKLEILSELFSDFKKNHYLINDLKRFYSEANISGLFAIAAREKLDLSHIRPLLLIAEHVKLIVTDIEKIIFNRVDNCAKALAEIYENKNKYPNLLSFLQYNLKRLHMSSVRHLLKENTEINQVEKTNAIDLIDSLIDENSSNVSYSNNSYLSIPYDYLKHRRDSTAATSETSSSITPRFFSLLLPKSKTTSHSSDNDKPRSGRKTKL